MSQMDTWEYKPQLQKDDGKVGPGGGTLDRRRSSSSASTARPAPGSPSCIPNVARHVDKLCFLRGLHTDTPAHPEAVIQLHTGTALASLTRPSMGAWLLYGLGTENQDLPGYVTINPPPNFGGAVNYGSAFLPAHFQGTRINDTGYLPNLKAQTALSLQRKQIDLIQAMNRDLAATPGAPDQLDGVIQSYELAFKMQGKVPELLDISSEPQTVLDAYGVKPGPAGQLRPPVPDGPAAERGGRAVRRDLPAGLGPSHQPAPGPDHATRAATDQPTAALLADLEQRGLLDETLVLFGSEFGRLPTAQGPDGRDHNITGYPMWLAGAGVKKGFSYGATDEYGINAVEGRMHTTDLHATLLALMGLDHEKLTYRYAGRDFRLTDVAGNVVREIMA